MAGEHAADLAFEAGEAGAFLQRGGGEFVGGLRRTGQHGGEAFAPPAAVAAEDAHNNSFQDEDADRDVLRERMGERRETRRVKIQQRHRCRKPVASNPGPMPPYQPLKNTAAKNTRNSGRSCPTAGSNASFARIATATAATATA